MARTYWLPDDEGGRLLWFTNFAGKLPTYATLFNIPAAEVTDMTNSLAVFNFAINRKRAFQKYAADLVIYTKLLANGKATDNLATFPVPPALGPVPPLVLGGVFKRVASIAARLKGNLSYTAALGQDLGIEGSDIVVDPATVKPQLALRLQAGHPEIGWRTQHMDALEIWKDSGSGFAMLDVDDAPNDTDFSPLPAAPALWNYKASYRLDGQQVGQWSDVVQIAVHA